MNRYGRNIMRNVATVSGERLSRVHLGLWGLAGWFSGPNSRKKSIQIIRLAEELGINAFDTAPVYGAGEGELLIGDAALPRDRIWITTKAGLRFEGSKESFFFESQTPHLNLRVYRNLSGKSIIEECELSLRRLKTDYIDLYLLHWPDPNTDLSESIEAMYSLHKRGLIRFAGLSNYNVEGFLKWKKELPDFPVLFSQNRYNLLQRKPEKNLIPYARKNKISFMAYSSLAQGLLSDRLPAQGIDLDRDDPRHKSDLRKAGYIERVRRALNSFSDLKEKYGANLATLSIAWSLGDGANRYSIAGAKEPGDCYDLSMAAKIRLSEEDRLFMAEATESIRNEWK